MSETKRRSFAPATAIIALSVNLVHLTNISHEVKDFANPNNTIKMTAHCRFLAGSGHRVTDEWLLDRSVWRAVWIWPQQTQTTLTSRLPVTVVTYTMIFYPVGLVLRAGRYKWMRWILHNLFIAVVVVWRVTFTCNDLIWSGCKTTIYRHKSVRGDSKRRVIRKNTQ